MKNTKSETPKIIATTTTKTTTVAIGIAKTKATFTKLIAHKLQINILNVITISARKRIGTPHQRSGGMRSRLFAQPTTRLMLLLLLLLLGVLLLVLLLAGSKFRHSVDGDGTGVGVGFAGHVATQNCNKLNGNSDRARNGRLADRRHHITNDTHATAVNGSGSGSGRGLVGNNAASDSGSEIVAAAVATVATQLKSVAANAALAERACNASAASRAKRFIIFSGSGVVKLVIGFSFPIMLADKVRSLSYFYNLQMQYTPPPRPIYWWSFYNSSTFEARRIQRQLTPWRTHERAERLQRRSWPTPLVSRRDFGREFMYAAIERIFGSHGLPGEVCLLRGICEVAQLPFYTSASTAAQSLQGLLHALLNAVLTPRVPNVPMKYLDARLAGRSGVDCDQTYKECSTHANKWLQRMTHIE